MDFYNVVTVEEGKNLIAETFQDFKLEKESVQLLDAVGRTLAEDVIAQVNVPDFNRSTVDGYAIVVEDSHGATETIPSILHIVGEVAMGALSRIKIKRGEAAYVPTGGMIPQGASGMVMIEHTEKMAEDTLLVYHPIAQGENVVLIGDDIQQGASILKKGRLVNAEVVGTLAALGIADVNVYKKPSAYIISTGDEIIDLEEDLSEGKIRDINSYALQVLLEEIGCQVTGKAIVKDDEGVLRAAVAQALEMADMVLISGGSSVGTRDYTHKVLKSFEGRGILAHGLSIKPGKPTIIGECKGKLLLGLPGHPVSSIVVFKALLEPWIEAKLGNNRIKASVLAEMEYNFPSSPGKETYQMVKLRKENGKYYAAPSHGKSGMISLLSQSQGYLVIQMHEEGVYKGEMREIYLL